MIKSEIQELIEAARSLQGAFTLSRPDFSAASVSAALKTASGAVFTGVNIDLACGIGFCAEHAAIAKMLEQREVEIAAIVAINKRGILPPCGRCRELMAQLSPKNAETQIILAENRLVPLRQLLPEHWLDH